MPESRRALVITYTFGNPIVAGVFFRAIRLATELRRRGWSSVILNFGPVLSDPKVQSLGSGIEVRNDVDTSSVWKALRQFRDVDPDLVIFGEAPFDGAMHLLWDAAAMLGKPFILLEQYYDLGTPGRFDVDMMLLYGLKCFWERRANSRRRWVIVSPFIGDVTPTAELPVPAPPDGAPRVLILGGESIVLDEGIKLAAELADMSPQVVALNGDPSSVARKMAEAGIPDTHVVTLPLQSDAQLFGLLQSSDAAIMANGFMQMTEALALGCPAVLINRGIGMWEGQVDEVFQPYVCFSSEREEQLRKLRGWLEQSPFDSSLLERLRRERYGTVECAGLVEGVFNNQHPWRMKWRQAKYRARHIGKAIRSRLPAPEVAA
jgi:hypothetical protein